MTKTVAVIFGGRSTEHDISIITAISSIINPLELTKKYEVEAIYLAKDGTWYWDEKLKKVEFYSSGKIIDFIKKTPPISVSFIDGMIISKQNKLDPRTKSKKIDIVFPAMHGTYGEDGSLMGFLEMAGIPYVGCGLAASAVAMDKVLAKQIAEANRIPISRMQFADKSSYLQNPKIFTASIEKSLNYPLFVKPAHLGSSIGISRAKDLGELENGLEVAFHYDDKVVVEEEVANLVEVTLPIMGNEKLKPALLERPLMSSKDFFDFDTKYLRDDKKGASKKGTKGAQGYSELPAKLPKALYQKAEQVGLDAYYRLGCEGIARVDMLIDKKSETVYFNEINPLPGSLYRHNWQAAGISSVELVENLIRLAEERYEKQQKTATIFETNYLKQF